MNRTMLNRKTVIIGILVIVACTGIFFSMRPVPALAKEDPWLIWIATLKGFDGEVRYVGDRDGYSYFQIGDFFKSYAKMKTDRTRLHEHFPLGSGKSCRPDQVEVPSY